MLKNQREDADRLFRAALAQDPDNPGYQLALLALRLGGGADERWLEAREDADTTQAMDRLTKVAHTATELVTVATYRLLQNRPEVALPLAERAVHADPDCWLCFHANALAAYRTGDAPRALALERDAFARLSDQTPKRAAAAVRAAIHDYQAATANPAAPAPAPTLFFPW
jgi:hypothetical protein